jgi:single-stranded-DNA-specific exonuclease
MKPAISKKWVLPEKVTAEFEEIFHEYPRPFQQLLYNRGFHDLVDARQFLTPDSILGDPFQLLNMEKVVERVLHAVHEREPIAIYGDYDVDGVTATALLLQFLQSMGALVTPYIPDRFDEGYGLNTTALDALKAIGIDLVISVDCGIRSVHEAEYAHQIGLDLIISDHHHPKQEVPPALAVVCPKQDDDRYPFKDFAGVGLAFKIAQAINQSEPRNINVEDWLDLVALGTVADMVPLVGENRILVRWGLNIAHQEQRLGIVKLAKVSGLNLTKLSSADISFILGPRLNAAGRLESARRALQLLLVDEEEGAIQIAQELDQQNYTRQRMTRDTQLHAQSIVKDHEYILFAMDKEFNEGIVGLAASKLVEAFYRPAIVGTYREDNTLRASCRSIPEFHITNALDECSELLVHYGGHALAAGFTIQQENIDTFIEKMESIASRELSGRELLPEIHADAMVTMTDLNPTLLDFFDQFEPTGVGNPAPLLVSQNVRVKNARTVGKDSSHLYLTLSDGRFTTNAIGFGLGHSVDKLPTQIDILFAFERNYYQGENGSRLRIVDMKY